MMESRTSVKVVGILLMLILASACGTGKTRVLFVTRSNAGLEFSNTPPTMELDIARQEGVVAPQFENGAKLPVLSSFKFENTGIFSPSVGSAFATGDAAVALAALYGDETPMEGDWEARLDKISAQPLSSLKLQEEPNPGRWFPLPNWKFMEPVYDVINPKLKFQKNDVRPVFFGTDTTMGIKIAWSGMSGQVPDSAKFGFNRKELALVPVTMREHLVDGKQEGYEMNTASLLATLDTATRTDGRPSLDTTYVQYLATGNAATLLALQKDVRRSMLARLDPYKESYNQQFGEVYTRETDASIRAEIVMSHIYEGLKTLSEDGDQTAKMHVAALDSLGELAPAEVLDYRWTPAQVLVEKKLTAADLLDSGRPTYGKTLVGYEAALQGSVAGLKSSFSAPSFQFQPDGAAGPTAPTQNQVAELKQRLKTIETALAQLRETLAASEVRRQAVIYYSQALTTQ